MAKTDLPKIAIFGAGPVGIEAALRAKSLKYPFTLFERGRVGEFMQRWGHVKLFTSFGMNVTALGLETIKIARPNHTLPADNAILTGREYVEAYLAPLAESLQASLTLETQVLQVGRRGSLKEQDLGDPRRAGSPFRILVRDKKSERSESADIILDCTGTYGQHRWLGDGGIPALGELSAEPNIAYGLEDVLGDRKNIYANRNILVVGGGYSAATTVCNLAQLGLEATSTWVVWIARAPGSQPLKRVANDPLPERNRLAALANNHATRTDANVEYHAETTVETVEFLGADKGFKVTTRCAGKPRTWEVERIIANVGYTPDRNLYRELQLEECPATLGFKTLKQPEPGFYVLGAKSHGRDASFFMKDGYDQVREAFALIAGKG